MKNVPKQKNISRIDSQHTHCWTVRLRDKRINKINKTFSDGVYGSKKKALQAAIIFRDKEIKKLNPLSYINDRCVSWPSFRSKGYYFTVRKRETVDDYQYYTAFCYDKFEGVQLQKTFGVVTWGGKKKARMKAIEWRNKTRMEVEKKAKKLGLMS